MAESRYGSTLPPDPEPAAGPTPEQQLAAERAERERLERQMAEEKAVLSAKMEMLERSVSQRWDDRPQIAPQVQQAREELNMSDEEILANPTAAVAKVADYVTRQRLAEQNQRNAAIIGNLAETSYQSQMQLLSQKEFYADLAPYINDYFARNPQERMIAGQPEKIYAELVGRNLEELERRRAARKAEADEHQNLETERQRTRQTSDSAPLRMPSVRGPETFNDSNDNMNDGFGEGDEAAAKKELMDVFNQYGVGLTSKEWKAIESGSVLPKKVAADWQRRR